MNKRVMMASNDQSYISHKAGIRLISNTNVSSWNKPFQKRHFMRTVTTLILLIFGASLSAQEFDDNQEKTQIEQKIRLLVEAWKAGDAQKFASPFTVDADFTVWFGLKLNGREEIAFGHNIIFENFYVNTIWDLKIDKIRFLGDDVALVHASGAISKEGDPKSGEPDAVPLIVFNKIGEEWKIVALHNTPFAVNEFRTNGDLKRMKRIARENMDK